MRSVASLQRAGRAPIGGCGSADPVRGCAAMTAVRVTTAAEATGAVGRIAGPQVRHSTQHEEYPPKPSRPPDERPRFVSGQVRLSNPQPEPPNTAASASSTCA